MFIGDPCEGIVGMQNPGKLTIEDVLRDFAASQWLKTALRTALDRDPVDAANDAEVLARLLTERCFDR